MTIAAVTTVVAGITLYAINAHISGWASSSVGTAFSIGGFFGIAALILGIMIPKLNGEMGKLGAQIQGKPTDEQAAQMQSLRKRLMIISYTNAACVIISVTLMATARFL